MDPFMDLSRLKLKKRSLASTFACMIVFDDNERLPVQDRQQKLTFLMVGFHFRQPEKCFGG
jgi:hypothetical protein